MGQGAITGMPPTARGRCGRTAAPAAPAGAMVNPSTSATPVGHASPHKGCTRKAPLLTMHQMPSCVPALPECPIYPIEFASTPEGSHVQTRRHPGPPAGVATKTLPAELPVAVWRGANGRTDRQPRSRGTDQRFAHRIFTRPSKYPPDGRPTTANPAKSPLHRTEQHPPPDRPTTPTGPANDLSRTGRTDHQPPPGRAPNPKTPQAPRPPADLTPPTGLTPPADLTPPAGLTPPERPAPPEPPASQTPQTSQTSQTSPTSPTSPAAPPPPTPRSELC